MGPIRNGQKIQKFLPLTRDCRRNLPGRLANGMLPRIQLQAEAFDGKANRRIPSSAGGRTTAQLQETGDGEHFKGRSPFPYFDPSSHLFFLLWDPSLSCLAGGLANRMRPRIRFQLDAVDGKRSRRISSSARKGRVGVGHGSLTFTICGTHTNQYSYSLVPTNRVGGETRRFRQWHSST